MEQRNVFSQFPSISFQKFLMFLMKSRFRGLQFLARAVKWKAWPSTACHDWMCCVRLVQIGGRNSFPLQRYVYLHEWVLFMANQVNIRIPYMDRMGLYTSLIVTCKMDTSYAPVMPLSPWILGKILETANSKTPDRPTSHTNVVGTSLDLSSCRIVWCFSSSELLIFVLSICESARKKKTSRICQLSQPKNCLRNPVQARRRISFFVKISKS